jgi:hypothetical protein
VLETVTGYLLASLLGVAKRKGEYMLDKALDKLVGRVRQELGQGPTERLRANPDDPDAQRDVQRQIRYAMQNDPAFAGEVRSLVSDLDGLGGQALIREVKVTGHVIHTLEPPRAPRGWVGVMVVIGIALCLTGLGIGLLGSLWDNSQSTPSGPYSPDPGWDTYTKLSFTIFFAGFVLLAVAGIAHQIQKNR